jgi:hypothetical protein
LVQHVPEEELVSLFQEALREAEMVLMAKANRVGVVLAESDLVVLVAVSGHP